MRLMTGATAYSIKTWSLKITSCTEQTNKMLPSEEGGSVAAKTSSDIYVHSNDWLAKYTDIFWWKWLPWIITFAPRVGTVRLKVWILGGILVKIFAMINCSDETSMIQRYDPGKLGKRHEITLPLTTKGYCLEVLKTQKISKSLVIDGLKYTSTDDPTINKEFETKK